VMPSEPVGQEAFAVMREAMRGKGMVALGRLVLSKRERVIALEPYDKGLRARGRLTPKPVAVWLVLPTPNATTPLAITASAMVRSDAGARVCACSRRRKAHRRRITHSEKRHDVAAVHAAAAVCPRGRHRKRREALICFIRWIAAGFIRQAAHLIYGSKTR